MATPAQGGGGAAGGGSMASKKEAAKALLKTGWMKTRSVLTNKSKIELLVEDATNLEPWGPTGQQMTEIAEACFDAEKFRQAWGVILRRFEAEPDQWRRIYKSLLLTEHLLKNSSQHVVQTIIDAGGILEGLKQFKYLDERNKDQGIIVSNRAKELVALLGNPDRIRAERAKAKSLKDKFKGATREEMTAAASGPSFGSSSAGGSGWAGAGAGSSARDQQSSGWGASGAGSGGNAGGYGSARPRSARPLPADDDGHLGEGGSPLGGEARPARGYGAVPLDSSDPVSATAQRIHGLRQAGLLREDAGGQQAGPYSSSDHQEGEGFGGGGSGSSHGRSLAASPGSRPMKRPSSESCLVASGAGGPGMSASRSCDNLSVADSGGSQTSPAKPSLHELVARRAGPKRLQDVRVNPAIASAVAALGGAGAGAGAAALPKPPAAQALAPPPAHPKAPAAAAGGSPKAAPKAGAAGSSPAHLADLLGGPAPAALSPLAGVHIMPAAGSGSPSAASSGSGSPTWEAAGLPTAFDAFASAPVAIPAPASPTAAKLGGGSLGTISLTATTAGAPAAAAPGSPPALPAYLFSEPTPPAYSSAASWGTHVGGASLPAQAKSPSSPGNPFGGASGGAKGAAKSAAPAEELFADFSPFK